jgi:hypothetical protein
MSPEPFYSAVVCWQCKRASLVRDAEAEASACAPCGARNFAIAGARFSHHDLPLFAELERIVYRAKLSRSEAMLVAGELEGVSLRWEPPESVLQRIAPRLDGMQALCDPKAEYSSVLLVISMLLIIVYAQMIDASPACGPSDLRRALAEADTGDPGLTIRHSKSG